MSLNEGRGDFMPEDARRGNADTPHPMATDFTGPLKGGPIVCKLVTRMVEAGLR